MFRLWGNPSKYLGLWPKHSVSITLLMDKSAFLGWPITMATIVFLISLRTDSFILFGCSWQLPDNPAQGSKGLDPEWGVRS